LPEIAGDSPVAETKSLVLFHGEKATQAAIFDKFIRAII
jgi:hypothetical protein